MTDVGYSLEEIRAERERRARRVPAGQDGQPITVEDIRRERARRASAQAQQPQTGITYERPRNVGDDLEGGLSAFNNGLFLNFNDEIQGGLGAIWEGGGEFARQVMEDGSPDYPSIGRAAQRGFDNAYDRSASARGAFQEARPNVAAFTEGTGMAAPILLTAGQSAPAATGQVVARGALARTATGQGIPAWAAQTARSGAAGAALGEVYGLGEDGDWQDRLDSGGESALYGAAFGAAAPTAVNAGRGALNLARPAWEGLVRQAERIPTPAPNTVGMSGGNLAAGGGRRQGALQPPPPPPEIPNAALNRVEAMAQRNRMSVDDVDQAFAGARSDPQGQVVVDLFGDTGVRTLRPMAQAPGETGGRAADVARERFQDAPNRIVDTLRRSLQVSESRAAAIQRLEGDYRRLSAEAYQSMWEQPVSPQQMALYEERIAPMLSPDNPNRAEREIMQDAIRRAEEQFGLDVSNGIVRGEITDNLPRYLHYIKGALGDVASFESSPLRGTSGRRLASIRQLYRRFGDMLDPPPGQGEAIIPNYRRTTEQAGDYFTAREALDEGGNWLNMSAEEVQRSRAGMSPFALEHARIGLADEIAQSVGLRGKVTGQANVANSQILNSPEGQRRLMAAFDSPQQAEAFISTVNQQNQLMRNAAGWGGGSTTYSNLAHGEDNALAGIAEIAGDAMHHGPGRGIMTAGRQIGNFFSDNAIERANNQAGEVLLRRIDSAEARAFTDELIRLLRQREQQRATNAAVSLQGGSGAGAASAAQRDRRE